MSDVSACREGRGSIQISRRASPARTSPSCRTCCGAEADQGIVRDHRLAGTTTGARIAGQSAAVRRESKASFFLIFSTIKLMFERSDLGPYFFKRFHVRCQQSTSRRIIFWKSNAAREKDLISCDGRDHVLAFGKRQQNLLV
jgi:hypothetical protein